MTITNDPLPEIETVWHDQRIDVLSLQQTKRYRSNVHEVIYNGVSAISKITAFDWDIPHLERETWAYSILEQYHREEFAGPQISPRVLGHLTECGRVIGLLMERQEGRFASLKDLPDCANALRKLQGIGLIHGDVNRYNFIVDQERGQVVMVDFEHAAAHEEESAREEPESLASELEEDTGRGRALILP